MIKTEIDLTPYHPMDRLRAARIAQVAARYESRLTLEREGMVLNAKSMLGLLSHAVKGSMLLVADGSDEQAATDAIVAIFNERPDAKTV